MRQNKKKKKKEKKKDHQTYIVFIILKVEYNDIKWIKFEQVEYVKNRLIFFFFFLFYVKNRHY